MVDLYDILLGDVIPESGVNISIGRNTYDGAAPTVPVHDIHVRRMDFHDSGASPGSGVVTYNSVKGVLGLNPSHSGVQHITTAVLFNAFDTGGGTLVGPSATDVTIDTVRVNTHPDVFVLANDELQINMSGIYEISYQGSADNPLGSRSAAKWGLYRQSPGGSYAQIDGTLGYSYHRQATIGEGTGNGSCILDDVVAGDKFKIQCTILGGSLTLTLLADASSLIAKKIG